MPVKLSHRKISSIKENPGNPRIISSEAVDAVAASIRKFGFLQPVVIDRGGMIAAGHVRLRAAKQIGLESVPCIQASDLTPAQLKAYALADNKTAEQTAWDIERLGVVIEDLKVEASDIDLQDFGFTLPELQAATLEPVEPEYGDEPEEMKPMRRDEEAQRNEDTCIVYLPDDDAWSDLIAWGQARKAEFLFSPHSDSKRPKKIFLPCTGA